MIDTAWIILMAYGALVGWAFVLGYAYWPKHQRPEGASWRRPWHRSAMGVNLMAFTGCMALTFAMLFVDAAFGPMPRWAWVAIVLLILATMTHRTYLLLGDRRKR